MQWNKKLSLVCGGSGYALCFLAGSFLYSHYQRADNYAEQMQNSCPLVPGSQTHSTLDPGYSEYQIKLENVSWEEVINRHQDVELGGSFTPKTCNPSHRLAVIVPYRDREEHLRIFLWNLHQLLKFQLLAYTIFVVNQTDDLPFNRGQLSNIGTLEAEKHGDYDCFVYHDVDLIPEKSKTTYKCFPWPLHLAIGVEQSQYIPYYGGVGGVAIVPKQLIHQVNGHSNNFWGWGGEDDDLLLRFNSQGFNVMHYPAEVGRYRSLPHVPASPSPNRYKILKKEGGKRDSGLSNVNYVLVQTRLHPLYTIFDVNLTLSVK